MMAEAGGSPGSILFLYMGASFATNDKGTNSVKPTCRLLLLLLLLFLLWLLLLWLLLLLLLLLLLG